VNGQIYITATLFPVPTGQKVGWGSIASPDILRREQSLPLPEIKPPASSP